MSVTLINGDGNPRVLASQDADWYGALTGQKTCIVPINDNLSATITDSNTVEIGSGVCITKEGRRVQIDEGDIEEIIIPTGTQGVDTYYIIGFHLYINESGQQVAETFVETMASATDTITETTFKEGSSSIYVSLYRVKRSGLLMDSVTRIIPTLKTIVDINDTLGSSDISAIGDGTVTGGLSQLNSDLSEQTMSVGVYLQYASDSALTNFVTFSNSAQPATAYKIAPNIYALSVTIVPSNVSITPHLYRIVFSNNGEITSNIQILNINVWGRNATVNEGIGAQSNVGASSNSAYLRNVSNPNTNWLPTSWNGNSDRVCVHAIVRFSTL